MKQLALILSCAEQEANQADGLSFSLLGATSEYDESEKMHTWMVGS